MDDYVFLEDGKRKAERWGKEIVGMKMDREDGGGRQVVGKSLALRRALAERGIDVDFLPEGMERRRKNQSHYNQKYVTPSFTSHHVDSQLPQNATRPALHGIQIPLP